MVIWIALEILYRMQYVSSFQKKLSEKSYSDNRPLDFQVLEKIGENILKYTDLKEQKILSKMRGRPALYDLSLQSYTLQKNRKNAFLVDF